MSTSEISEIDADLEKEDEEFFDSESELPLIQTHPVNEETISSAINNLNFAQAQTKFSTINSANTPTRSYTPIYAVQFKTKPLASNTNASLLSNSRIFINADTAMKLCKQDPEYRRFKVFKNFKDAYAFSYEVEIESGKAPSIEQVKASLPALSNVPFSPSQENATSQYIASNSPAIIASNQTTSNDAEKLPYSAPKKADINQMRILAEKDDFEKLIDLITSNPRFLISSGDSPVVVQVRI